MRTILGWFQRVGDRPTRGELAAEEHDECAYYEKFCKDFEYDPESLDAALAYEVYFEEMTAGSNLTPTC